MPDFVGKTGLAVSPFGVNEFLRSWQDIKTFPAMVAAASVQGLIRDGNHGQKILQPGTVMAKITSGPSAGLYGPFQAAGTSEVQTITKGTGTYSAGSYTLQATGSTDPANKITVPYADNATAVQALIDGMPAYAAYEPTVTGGPLGSAALVVTFGGGDEDADVPLLILDVTGVTGETGVGTVATGTPGVAGSNDGRSTAANIVGLNLTVVPWQLTVRDVEVSIVYEASVVQGWCIELDINGNPQPLSNTTAAYMQRGGAAGKSVDLSYH